MPSGSTTCEFRDNHWVLNGDPFVLHRSEDVFPLSKRRGKEIWIPATPEQSRELMWFRLRFPLKVDPETKMRKQCADFLKRESRAEIILSEDYQPQDIEFAKGESPREYQAVAADLIKATGGLLLADGLGTGKTVSALAAIADKKVRPALVVVPPHLALQWQTQIRRFLPRLRPHIIHSGSPYDLDIFTMCPGCGKEVDRSRNGRCLKCRINLKKYQGRVPDVIICSYMKLSGWAPALSQICKSVFFDEGHSLRRSQSKKWRAATQIARAMSYRCVMTATPLYNMGGEIWNILSAVRPGFLGPKQKFQEKWCGYGRGDGKEPPLKDPDALGSYLRRNNVMLRRTAKDVGIELGQCNQIVHRIEASGDVFNKATDRAGELARILLKEAGESRKSATVEFDNMLRQATGLAKAPFVCSFVEMLLQQKIPTVLYAWHRAVYDVIFDKLQDYKPVFYTGQETASQKEASVEKFLKGQSDLFVCSLRSGEGLDGLQARSSTCVFGELDWSWSVLQQCVGRLDRFGQKEPVTSYLLLSDYGLDPVMAEVLNLKKDQILGLIGERQTGPVKQVDSAAELRKLARKYLTH